MLCSNEGAHPFIGCAQLSTFFKRMIRLGHNDNGNQIFYHVEGKRCPGCAMVINKTEGCNHIVCRCSYAFCYVCLEKWESKHYMCNPSEGDERILALETSSKDIKRIVWIEERKRDLSCSFLVGELLMLARFLSAKRYVEISEGNCSNTRSSQMEITIKRLISYALLINNEKSISRSKYKMLCCDAKELVLYLLNVEHSNSKNKNTV
ncbi:hypothetical protein ACOME3_001788 [Neoechinorhynchus agilis]